MSKTIVVFGASGTIGQGFIKATLEKGNSLEHNFSGEYLFVASLICSGDELAMNFWYLILMQVVSRLLEYSDQKNQQRRFLLGWGILPRINLYPLLAMLVSNSIMARL